MGENSKIEWTDATWNPWRGCTKVSAGCQNCYADTLSKRNPGTLGVWGPNGTRVVAAESYWREPLKWDRDAKAAGVRRRVFCASLADVFEGYDTMPRESRVAVSEARTRLARLILATPCLNWLLLTKRPENVGAVFAEIACDLDTYEAEELDAAILDRVWLGTSVEDQQRADERIPHLPKCPAAVRFLSCEPLLSAVDLRPYLGDAHEQFQHHRQPAGINWVIVGSESGPRARPMEDAWVRSLRDQCDSAKIPFFFKQQTVAGRKIGLPMLDGRQYAQSP